MGGEPRLTENPYAPYIDLWRVTAENYKRVVEDEIEACRPFMAWLSTGDRKPLTRRQKIGVRIDRITTRIRETWEAARGRHDCY